VWSLLGAWLSASISACFTVQASPSLVSLDIKSKLFTTGLDGYTMLVVDFGNNLCQGLFSLLWNVFALEGTI
jgi:hypothetical protein